MNKIMKTLYASFADVKMAEQAAGALLDQGVLQTDLSIVSKNSNSNDSSGFMGFKDPEKHPNISNPSESIAKSGITTTTKEDASAGAVKGAEIGLGLGVVAALVSLLVPGVGLVVGGGALAMALAGAAGTTAAGALAGGVTGYLRDQGVPHEAVEEYHGIYENGGAILALNTPSGKVEQVEAEAILHKYQAGFVRIYGDPNG